jgi:hypothetical protein
MEGAKERKMEYGKKSKKKGKKWRKQPSKRRSPK